MSSSNNTYLNTSLHAFSIYYTYIMMGIIAVCTNALIIIIYLTSKNYFTRFTMLAGLAFADLIIGAAFITTGIVDVRVLKTPIYTIFRHSDLHNLMSN